MDIEELRAIPDPVERARAAGAFHERMNVLGREASRIRREAIEDLQRDGMTQSAIAVVLGLSRGRIGQLVSSGPPAERLFFGTDTLTIAMGGKLEAGKSVPGSVLATEDMHTFGAVKELLRPMQLDAVAEVIPPPGVLRLNRENLFAICGPRLSPLLAQILESDPVIEFLHDEQGWFLRDRRAGEDYRSPMDDGDSRDIAYFGRLPRPDGRGTFLYSAGIHAPGPGGVITWLQTKAAELYREVGMKRFSTLIETTFDPETGQALSGRRISPIYVHDQPK